MPSTSRKREAKETDPGSERIMSPQYKAQSPPGAFLPPCSSESVMGQLHREWGRGCQSEAESRMLFGNGLSHVVITVPLCEGTWLYLLWGWPLRTGTEWEVSQEGKEVSVPGRCGRYRLCRRRSHPSSFTYDSQKETK